MGWVVCYGITHGDEIMSMGRTMGHPMGAHTPHGKDKETANETVWYTWDAPWVVPCDVLWDGLHPMRRPRSPSAGSIPAHGSFHGGHLVGRM